MFLTPGSWPVMAIGFVVTIWLGLAIWALVHGVGMQRSAAFAETQASRLATLLDSAPALPMMVRPDLRIEAPERLAQWLGLAALPKYFDDLAPHAAKDGEQASGLSAEQVDLLRKDLVAAQKGGKPFTRSVRLPGANRTLLIKGAHAASKLASPGSVILWIFDATESQTELEELRTERTHAVDAFNALAGVIEAAPFPMWFRGPNMQLQLVNQAYVRATTATTAERVITEGIELIEPIAGQSAMQTAQLAADRDKVSIRSIPVTMHGERRMTRVIDVPVEGSGVAGYAIDVQEFADSRAEHRRFVEAQRDMLDRSSAAVAQFGGDRQLRFTNQPFRRMFGLDAAWLAEHGEFNHILEKLRETGKTPAVRDYPAWREERRGWFSANEVQEEMWLLLDGTHLRVVAQPNPDGGLLLLIEDRTEQVQLSSAHDTLLRVRTATFDNLFEAIGVFQADGRLHLWNRRFREIWSLQAQMLATHPRIDQLLTKAAHLLEKPEQASIIQELVRAATIDRRQRSGRVRFADGRHFEFAAIPLPDGNALFTMLDISDSHRNAITMSREETPEPTSDTRSVDLARLIRSAAGRALTSAHGAGIDIALQVNPDVGSIEGDEQRIRQALDHLIENAARYTKEARRSEGRLLIHADGDNKAARIVVSDNGSGMDAAEWEEGAGVSSVRQTIEMHKGNLELVSEPGAGTMVTVILPR